MRLDETHDPKRQSWVTSANGHPDFPIQNLPRRRILAARRHGKAWRCRDRRYDLRSCGRSRGGAVRGRRAQRRGGDSLPARSTRSLDWGRQRGRPCALVRPSFLMRKGRIASASRGSATGFCTAQRSASCIFQLASATTLISTSAFIMPQTSARSSGPTILFCRTTSTYRSATTGAPRLSCRPARRCGVHQDN